jgi:hypothetical protein
MAHFEFAESREVRRKDVGVFKKIKSFSFGRYQDSVGHFRNIATYFHGLKGQSNAEKDLPEGYSLDEWNHSRYLKRRKNGDEGTIICRNCHTRKKAELAWPEMAFFKVDIKGDTLWAFHRESALDLYNFIASAARDQSAYRWAYFLRHVPGKFLTAKVRDEVCRKLKKLLS